VGRDRAGYDAHRQIDEGIRQWEIGLDSGDALYSPQALTLLRAFKAASAAMACASGSSGRQGAPHRRQATAQERIGMDVEELHAPRAPVRDFVEGGERAGDLAGGAELTA